ncbi:MAG: hypothetical protein M0T74_11430 [Desulfitobacterium hafniense]|nr:hypothetical protein [Desulfitobacterium hafniense]
MHHKSKNEPHPYHRREVCLATMHGKELAISAPFQETLGIFVRVPKGIDTDVLGTFSGEVEREGTPLEVLRKKIRLGMSKLGLSQGIGSEGSFGPYVHFPLIAQGHEILLWIDDERGIEVVEQKITTETNYGFKTVSAWEELGDFLKVSGFPSHALIVRPNSGFIPGLIFKGLRKEKQIKEAIERSASASNDSQAQVITDMRAHMNPTRMKVIGELAEKLARRIATLCPNCLCPGWGLVDIVRGLPCELCGLKTEQIAYEVYGCPSCNEKNTLPRQDGILKANPASCGFCNP